MKLILLLLSAICLVRPADASTQFPSAFEHEPPRVRAALEKAYITFNSGADMGGLELAYLEFCEAARMGSAEGHYQAGFAAMKLPQTERQFVLYHWQAADNMGHPGAGLALGQHATLLGSQMLRDSPKCLTSPPDLVAMRNQFKVSGSSAIDFSSYAGRLPADRRKVLELVREMALESSLDAKFILAIAAVESNFNSVAVSPKNAMGVMQLIPATASRFGVRNPYDARENIQGGIRYLEWLSRRFKGDLRLVAAAYNSGEGSVDRYKGVPPFAETQLYVQKVLRYIGHVHPVKK